MPPETRTGPPPRVVGYGRVAWSLLGVLGLLWVALYVVSRVDVVVIALLIGVFPAALMSPLASRLRRTAVPNALSALLLVVALVLVFAVPAWWMVPRFADQVPVLADAVVRGLETLESVIDFSSLPGNPEGLGDLAEEAFAAVSSGDVVDQGLAAASALTKLGTGTLLVLVVLFFCVKDGPRLWAPFAEVVPARHRDIVQTIAEQVWWTLGAYLRGQLLVALFDAVLIGLGLWLLGIPLALPLAVLVFFGGLFPIVGAFVSGLVAVLVALADQGLVTALVVLALILVVQQIEGNVLQPIIMASIIELHPLLIILSVTAGAYVLGVLGAFLAVPLAAAAARAVDLLRGRTPAAGPASQPSGGDEDESALRS